MTYDPSPSSPYGPDQSGYQPWQQPTAPQYGQPPSPYGPPPADSPYSAPPVPSPGPSYPPPAYQTSAPAYQTSGPAYQTSSPAYPTSGPGYPQPGYPTPAPQPPKKSNVGLIIGLVAVILVVVCGGGIAVVLVLNNKSKPSPSPTHGPVAGATTGAPAPTNTGGGGVNGSGTVPFGADHGVEWHDHIQASVLSVQRFTPSSTAAGTHSGQVGVKVTVKITNNSGKQLDLTLAQVKLKSGDNGTQADDIIDIENNITLGFEGAVAPGHSATALYAFSVPPGDLNKLDVEVTPGFDYDAGIFEGAAS
jgi:hypothetical protein